VQQILEVCYKAGVTHVTIYAFSIENFKRSKYEVDGLMEMAKIKLKQLVQHGDILDRYGARIQILGQRELIKPDVLEAVDRAVASTAHNNKCVLNVCFPYTSREEITSAIRDTVEEYSTPIERPSLEKRRPSPFKEERIANTIRGQHLSDHKSKSSEHLQPPQPLSPSSSTASLASTSPSSAATDPSEQDPDARSTSTSATMHSPSSLPTKQPTAPTQPVYPNPENITPATISSHLYTSACPLLPTSASASSPNQQSGLTPPVDLLIRTSGVSRLSDFLLWQTHENTEIVFLDVLWPDFDLWSFLPVLWSWQWRVRKETDRKREGEEEEQKRMGLRVGSFRESLKAE
jgi:ditrans,polycis-polyprenyl diphosphate synthase